MADVRYDEHEVRLLDSSIFPCSEIKTDFLRGCLAPSTSFQEAAALVQLVVKEPNQFVATSSDEWYGTTLLAYSKDRVWAWNPLGGLNDQNGTTSHQHSPDDSLMYAPRTFAKIPVGALNPLIVNRAKDQQSPTMQQHGGFESDVWSMDATHLVDTVRPPLDELAAKTHDRPVPKYHNLIDPNLFVRTRPDGTTVWVPSEFDVSSDGATVELVGGDNRAHWMDRQLIDATATPVLRAALPLLAQLTKPCLLLQGQRLQVAVKAQRIELPPKGPNDDDVSDYVGLWHVDGDHEPVAAVVLFYYHMDSDSLAGGAVEFLDRQPLDVLGVGDTMEQNLNNYNRSTLREALRPDDGSPIIPNCAVAVKTGTLLVFSNYQMIHRVLRMINTSTQASASRDFVALFVLDPASRPLVPARIHQAKPAAITRTLAQWSVKVQQNGYDDDGDSRDLPADPIQLILEFAGVIPSAQSRVSTRNKLLRSQLKPRAHLTASGKPVCSIGNGCFSMIGWLDDMLAEDDQ